MSTRVHATIAAAMFVLALAVSADAATFASAKTLYAAAAYEEALSELANADEGTDVDQIEQYRALCLIALGRTDEASRSLERIVTRNPTYRLSEADAPPRLVSLFKDARQRVLPAAAKERYGKAKASFDARDFGAAAKGFRELLAIIGDSADTPGVADLQQLASGFLTLSEASLPPVAAPPATEANVPSPTAAATVYSPESSDVVPPVEVERTMPQFALSRSIGAYQIKGALAVVIDEAGRVESARMVKATLVAYDRQLLAAAQRWVFRPATKAGTPVKFRKVYSIVLVSQP